MLDPYRPVAAKLERVIDETPNIKTFTIKPDQPIGYRTGQFVELALPGFGEAPFTPSSSPSVSEQMDITIMDAGSVTSRLHKLKAGAMVGVRGPYGAGYPLDEFAGKTVLIVGGGVGLAPLRSLLFALFEDTKGRFERIVLCYGARSPQDLVYKDALKQWGEKKQLELHVSVDVGDKTWTGKVGVVTILLNDVQIDVKKTVAVACGPPVMMFFATKKLLDMGFADKDIYLSMEKNMSCGLGKCGHCRLGPYYACKDGPVFTYDKIKGLPGIWD